MNNNNNNNNNNKNHENLFWKVFKNKFLINKIINYIQTIEWVIYDQHSQLHIDNRIKFKNIHSLKWMIDNKQYQLLKYKLKSNQYIDINKESITTLFKQLSIKKDRNNDDDYDNDDNDNNNNNNNNNSIDEINLIKELIVLLLEKKRDEFEIIDLTLEAVECNSIEVLKLLSNEPYSIIIYPSTLEYAIQNSHPLIVDEILKIYNNNNNSLYNNNNNNIKDELKKIKNQSLFFVLNNNNFKFEMIEFIFSNFKNEITTTITNNSNSKSHIKAIDNQHKRIKVTDVIKDVSINLFLYLIKGFKMFDFFKFENALKIYQSLYLNEIYMNNNNNNSSISNGSTFSIKDLQRLSIIKLKQYSELHKSYISFYNYYIETYKQVIDEIHYSKDSIIGKDNIVVSILKYEMLIEVEQLIIGSNPVLNKEEIINDCKTGSLVWNEILLEIVVRIFREQTITNDKSKLDWIFSCKNKSILSFIKKYFKRISFETLELADHYYNDSGLLEYLSIEKDIKHSIYSNVWFESVLNSDFKTIEYIESLQVKIQEISLFENHLKRLSIDQFFKYINYLNESGFQNFDEHDFIRVFDYLYRVCIYNTDDIGVLWKIKFNFNSDNDQYNESIKPLLMHSIIDNDWYRFLFLVNSNIFNKFILSESIDMDYFNEINESPRIIFDKTKINHIDEGYTMHMLLDFIYELLSLIETSKIKYNSTHQISVIINYYFEKLIQIQGVSMKDVEEIYNLIQENSIIINHTIYHVFYYLHIKDIKYTKYITSPSFVCLLLKFSENYDCSEIIENGINLKDFLDPSEFSFQMINCLPFDTIIEMLEIRLYKMLINGIKNVDQSLLQIEFYNQLNRDLEYYLIIKRNDLFFKKLNNIKIMFEKENEMINDNNNNSNSNLYKKSFIIIESTLNRSNLKFQFNKPLYTFEFSQNLIKYICKVFEIDEIIRIIGFNYYQDSFLSSDLLLESINLNRFDIIKLIFNYLKIKIYIPITFSNHSSSLFNLLKLSELVEFPWNLKNLKLIKHSNNRKLFKFKLIYLLNQYFQNDKAKFNDFINSKRNDIREY